MSLHEHVHPHLARSPRAGSLAVLPTPSPTRAAQRPEPFGVEIRPARRRVVVAPRGELDLATVDIVAEAVDELVETGFDEVVLDLRGLSFMDSTGLRLVIRQVRRHDVAVRLIDGTGPVSRLFDLTATRAELPFLAPHEVLRG